MKGLVTIIGVLLIILGGVGFSYRYFNYTTNEKIAQIGSVEVTADQEKTVFISPVLSGISLAAGIVLVVVGISRKQ